MIDVWSLNVKLELYHANVSSQFKCLFANQFMASCQRKQMYITLFFALKRWNAWLWRSELSDNYIYFVCKLVVWGKVLNALNTSKQIFKYLWNLHTYLQDIQKNKKITSTTQYFRTSKIVEHARLNFGEIIDSFIA